jgi:hypothetical protein
MVITVPPEIEDALEQAARQLGVTPEGFVLAAVRARLAAGDEQLPQDAWETSLRRVGAPAGVSLSDEATDRELLYD